MRPPKPRSAQRRLPTGIWTIIQRFGLNHRWFHIHAKFCTFIFPPLESPINSYKASSYMTMAINKWNYKCNFGFGISTPVGPPINVHMSELKQRIAGMSLDKRALLEQRLLRTHSLRGRQQT